MDGEFSTPKPVTSAWPTATEPTGRPPQQSLAMSTTTISPTLSTWLSIWMLATVVVTAIVLSGCANRYGHILASNDKDLVGSHSAGAATWNPLVDSSVAQLLGRCPPPSAPLPFGGPLGGEQQFAGNSTTPSKLASHNMSGDMQLADPSMLDPSYQPQLATGPARVCFIGIENKSAEELVDFKDQLYERIDSQINAGEAFRSISRRMVDAALIETRLRPDSLFLPDNRAAFAAALGRQGTPVDYLLYATITSGTTDRNKSTQRDYVLTLEMVNLHSGDYIKESATIRKGYHKTRGGKWWNFGIFDQADG